LVLAFSFQQSAFSKDNKNIVSINAGKRAAMVYYPQGTTLVICLFRLKTPDPMDKLKHTHFSVNFAANLI
jgi:hypothetical protein